MFFQSHKVFEVQMPNTSDSSKRFKIHMDLNDLALQEIFELWSNLGNKQFPFILYKARVLKVIDKDRFETTHLIEKTNVLSRKEA